MRSRQLFYLGIPLCRLSVLFFAAEKESQVPPRMVAAKCSHTDCSTKTTRCLCTATQAQREAKRSLCLFPQLGADKEGRCRLTVPFGHLEIAEFQSYGEGTGWFQALTEGMGGLTKTQAAGEVPCVHLVFCDVFLQRKEALDSVLIFLLEIQDFLQLTVAVRPHLGKLLQQSAGTGR